MFSFVYSKNGRSLRPPTFLQTAVIYTSLTPSEPVVHSWIAPNNPGLKFLFHSLHFLSYCWSIAHLYRHELSPLKLLVRMSLRTPDRSRRDDRLIRSSATSRTECSTFQKRMRWGLYLSVVTYKNYNTQSEVIEMHMKNVGAWTVNAVLLSYVGPEIGPVNGIKCTFWLFPQQYDS